MIFEEKLLENVVAFFLSKRTCLRYAALRPTRNRKLMREKFFVLFPVRSLGTYQRLRSDSSGPRAAGDGNDTIRKLFVIYRFVRRQNV